MAPKPPHPVVKKRHKHAPPELSSARPTPPGRDDLLVSTVALPPHLAAAARDAGRRRFDPRFDPACSTGDAATATRSYAFLRDMRAAEEAELDRAARRGDDAAARRLKSMRSVDEAAAERAREEDVRRTLRREERDRVASGGKRAWYVKEKVVKEKVIERKFEELKSSGRLQKYVERRRKREAGKDKRLLPSERQT